MNSAAHWTLIVDPAVYKALKRFPKGDANRILAVIAEMMTNPYSGDIRKMKGETDVWRRRVGAYRLFFEVTQVSRTVHLYAVQRRTSATY